MNDRNDLRDQVVAQLTGQNLIHVLGSRMGLALKPVGREYVMLCPFHSDEKPSLTVNITKHPDKPILKCFSCGWGGDPLKLIQEYYRLDFKEALDWAAGALGLSGKSARVMKPADGIQTRTAVAMEPAAVMTPEEVRAAYLELKRAAKPPEPYAEKLGIDPRAMLMCGSFVSTVRGSDVLVFPMRDENGRMTSLRFRSFRPDPETGRFKRWSLDVRERGADGQRVQTKVSTSGLMALPEYFDKDICLDGMVTIVVEGETDYLALVTMLLKSHGGDVSIWPARPVALPGVNSCHDLLLKSRLTRVVMLFFDDDRAGHWAAFDRRPTRRVNGPDGQPALDGQGKPVFERDFSVSRIPGLISKLTLAKIQGLAVFPPTKDGEKFDLRSMLMDGWTWRMLDDYCRRNGSTDPNGLAFFRRRAAAAAT